MQKRGEKKKEDNKTNDQSKSSKQTINNSHQPLNPPRAPQPKKSPILRSSSCQPNMSNVLADIKRAHSKENAGSRGTLAQSAPASHTNSDAQVSENQGTSSEQLALPQCSKMQEADAKRSKQSRPSQILNNESLEIKYPDDEPVTPERTPSPVVAAAQPPKSTPIASQKLSEPEDPPIKASTSEASGEQDQKNISPRTGTMSRRDRRERVRSRSLAQSKARSTTQVNTPVTNSTPVEAPSPAKQEKTVPKPGQADIKTIAKPSQSPPAAHTSARAAARDRYARHKKMMHQRHAAN